jgi:hypothetical protein
LTVDHKRKVPEEAKLSAMLKKGKSLSDIAKACGVRPAAVRLHAARYGLIECRTGAARRAEALARIAPDVRRKGDITHREDRITFTRETHVPGHRGQELRDLSLPCPHIYRAAVTEKLRPLRGEKNA